MCRKQIGTAHWLIFLEKIVGEKLVYSAKLFLFQTFAN